MAIFFRFLYFIGQEVVPPGEQLDASGVTSASTTISTRPVQRSTR
jgi:hypothetical protein